MNAIQEVLPESLDRFLRGETRPLSDLEADLVYAVGQSLYDTEDYAGALDVFRLLVLGAPGEARSWASLAITHDALGDNERAIPLYQLACSAPRGGGWQDRARLYLARALWAAARFDEARDWHDEVDVRDLGPELLALHGEIELELAERGRS